MVAKVKPVVTQRLATRLGTATVRVRLAVTATGTATGYGDADACRSGVSNPRSITATITWDGTRTAGTTSTASGRTIRPATRVATREASKIARAASEG